MSPDDVEFGFDATDTELGRRLRAAAPREGDADAVLSELRPRLVRARRRRQAGIAVVGVAALALFAGLAFAAIDSGPGARVRVPPATRPAPSVEHQPAPTTPEPAIETPAATLDESGHAGGGTSDPGGTPTVTEPGDDHGGGDTADDHGGDSSGSESNESSGSESSGSGSDGSGSHDSGSHDSGSGDSGSGD